MMTRVLNVIGHIFIYMLFVLTSCVGVAFLFDPMNAGTSAAEAGFVIATIGFAFGGPAIFAAAVYTEILRNKNER